MKNVHDLQGYLKELYKVSDFFSRYTYFIICINKLQWNRKHCTAWCISLNQVMVRLKKSPLSIIIFDYRPQHVIK